MENLFRHIPRELSEEWVQVVVETPNLRIERIVSVGHRSPDGFWYDSSEHEWVTLLTGHAVIEFDDGTSCTMQPGDHLRIAAHQRHRVASTSSEPPAIWLAVHYLDAPDRPNATDPQPRTER